MRAEGFVIHLRRAVQRRPQAERLVATLPLAASMLDAVDGKALDPQVIAAVYRPALHSPRYPFPLLDAEVAVFLSHRRAWTAIVERGLDAGLIVEDDVELDGDPFAQALAFALRAVETGDYLRFPYRTYSDKGRVLAREGVHELTLPRHAGLGMQAQLVTREAASRLLAATEAFDRPVDALVQMRWLTGIRLLAMRPGSIHEIGGALGGTVTQKKDKPLGEVISRAVKRAAYRMAVRLRDRGGR